MFALLLSNEQCSRSPRADLGRSALVLATSRPVPSATATITSGGRPHPTEYCVVAYIVVPESRKGMDTNEREEDVRQIAVDILGGMEDRPVGSNSEIHLEQAEIEHAAVPNEGDDAENRYHEHKNV